MEPDVVPDEQSTVTMYEEPGNADLEPIPPFVPEKLVDEYVARWNAEKARKRD